MPAYEGASHLVTSPVQDARRVLPKGLLAKLRKHCTGLVYVPVPPRDSVRHEMVLRLRASGMSVRSIAQSTGLSTKSVRRIIEGTDSVPSTRPTSRFLRLVPPDLVPQIQRHVVGRLYIPPRQTKKTGRTRRVGRLLDEGLSVAEIAGRVKLSERQVYRLKKAWSENAWRREMGQTGQQSRRENPENDELPGPRAAVKLCRGCGRPIVGRGATHCELCRTIEGGSDGEVIALTKMPFATFDPKF